MYKKLFYIALLVASVEVCFLQGPVWSKAQTSCDQNALKNCQQREGQGFDWCHSQYLSGPSSPGARQCLNQIIGEYNACVKAAGCQ